MFYLKETGLDIDGRALMWFSCRWTYGCAPGDDSEHESLGELLLAVVKGSLREGDYLKGV